MQCNLFHAMSIDSASAARAGLERWYGFPAFRSLQESTVTCVMEGRDCVSILGTGVGKTLCYTLPGVLIRERDPTAIVVVASPLISLLVDQCTRLNALFGLSVEGRPVLADSALRHGPIACFLGSSQPDRDAPKMAARGDFLFVLACPETLLGWMPRATAPTHVLHVVDEAHLIAEGCEEYRPCYRELGAMRVPGVPMLALTATATPVVEALIVEELRMVTPLINRAATNRPNLTYIVRRKAGRDADVRAMSEIVRSHDHSIVYVLTRRQTEWIASALTARGISASGYHGKMESVDRARIQRAWMAREFSTIVATISFGCGIDCPDVRRVVHYGMPRSLAAFSQETGRAGRDGAPSVCVMFVGPGDLRTHAWLSGHGPELRAIADMAMGSDGCRRHAMLATFGETCATPCRNSTGDPGCDACGAVATVLVDASVPARRLLLNIKRTPRRGVITQVGDLRPTQRHKLLHAWLLAAGYIELVWFVGADGHGVVVYELSPRGVSVAGLETAIELRIPARHSMVNWLRNSGERTRVARTLDQYKFVPRERAGHNKRKR